MAAGRRRGSSAWPRRVIAARRRQLFHKFDTINATQATPFAVGAGRWRRRPMDAEPIDAGPMGAELINSRPVILISFDIDGTVEGGDPSGPVPLEFVRRVSALGALVGSSSDRTITDQRHFWRAGRVRTGFVVL